MTTNLILAKASSQIMKKYPPLLLAFLFFVIISCSKSQESKKPHNAEKKEAVIEVIEEDTSFVLKQFDPKQIWPYYSNGKWGYINNDNEFVIKPVFDGCGLFSEGFAWVIYQGKYKIINKHGDYINEQASFDGVAKAHKNIIPVKRGKLWGAVDTTAKQIIDFEYEELSVLDQNLVLIMKNRKWGLADNQGKEICLPVYDHKFHFDGGTAIVSRNYGDFGIINKSGKEIVKCQFDGVEVINDSIFKVFKEKSYGKKDYGLIINENIKYPVEYKRIQHFNDSLLVLTNDSISGILNMKGDTIFKFIYSDLKAGNTNLLAAKNEEKWGYINLKNETVISFIEVRA